MSLRRADAHAHVAAPAPRINLDPALRLAFEIAAISAVELSIFTVQLRIPMDDAARMSIPARLRHFAQHAHHIAWREHLDGDLSIKPLIARQHDDAHAAAAKLTVDAVLAAEGGAKGSEFAHDRAVCGQCRCSKSTDADVIRLQQRGRLTVYRIPTIGPQFRSFAEVCYATADVKKSGLCSWQLKLRRCRADLR